MTGTPVAVAKPLEWTTETGIIHDAISICGLYRVRKDEGHYAAYIYHGTFAAERATLDEAKAAAQADYEARIRSALTPDTLALIERAGRMEAAAFDLDQALAAIISDAQGSSVSGMAEQGVEVIYYAAVEARKRYGETLAALSKEQAR